MSGELCSTWKQTKVMKNQLTERDREVLELVLQGKSNKEICSLLCEDQSCIKTRIRAAYRKLGIRSTRELLPIAATTKELLQISP